MKQNAILPLFLLCYGMYAQPPAPLNGYVNCAAISNNISCGVGEIFIIPEITSARPAPKEPLLQDIVIYPNPVIDAIHIDSDLSFLSISVYSLDGKLLLQQDVSRKNTIDVSCLTHGTYLLVSNDQKFNAVKFLKQ